MNRAFFHLIIFISISSVSTALILQTRPITNISEFHDNRNSISQVIHINTRNQEFMVHKGSAITTNLSYTIFEGIDYDLILDNSSRAFILLSNSRKTGAGEIINSNTQRSNSWQWCITDPSNIENSITFKRASRVSMAYPVRFSWVILEYIGNVNDRNEIIVHQTELLSGSSNNRILQGLPISDTNFNQTRSVIFITSQASNEWSNRNWWMSLNTADFAYNGYNWIPEIEIGKSTGSTQRWVSYTVVEFSGSNWRDIQRIETTQETTIWQDDPFVDRYENISILSPLLNTSRTFLETQYMTSADDTGLDDAGDTLSICNGVKNFLQLRNKATYGIRTKVAWIIESISSSINVEHLFWYENNGGSEERIDLELLQNQLRATNQSVILGTGVSCDGSGTAYPRGSVDFSVYNTTHIQHITSDSGQEYIHSIDIVQLPLSEISEDPTTPKFIDWYQSKEPIYPMSNVFFYAKILDYDSNSSDLNVKLFHSLDSFNNYNLSSSMRYIATIDVNTYLYEYEMTGKPSQTTMSYYYRVADNKTSITKNDAGLYYEIQWSEPVTTRVRPVDQKPNTVIELGFDSNWLMILFFVFGSISFIIIAFRKKKATSE